MMLFSLSCLLSGVATNWVHNADQRNPLPNEMANRKLFTGSLYISTCAGFLPIIWMVNRVCSSPNNDNRLNPLNIGFYL